MKTILPDDAWRGFILPFFQAIATGVFVFVAGLAVCLLRSLPWWYALAGSALVTMIAWLAFLGWWSKIIKALLLPGQPDQVEYYTPDPEPEPAQSIRVEIMRENDGYIQADWVDLPASRDQLLALSDGLTRGESLGLGSWTGRNKPFSRSEFEVLRSEMLKRGLITWSNPKSKAQGFELTVVGQHVFRKIATNPPGRSDPKD